ncbi:MAG TPA: hypothetical protein VE127_17555 [Solirubrobacteraceae bacterium]|jgi:hypothetical protein|nr:hypothetical protein [Solirubrobacteraceae bacterium]
MTAETLTSIRELDSRASNGVQIRLLWCEHDNSVWVTVIDTRNGEAFRLEVAADERPLDVFAHPFAYAAAHGIPATALPGPADPVSSL